MNENFESLSKIKTFYQIDSSLSQLDNEGFIKIINECKDLEEKLEILDFLGYCLYSNYNFADLYLEKKNILLNTITDVELLNKFEKLANNNSRWKFYEFITGDNSILNRMLKKVPVEKRYDLLYGVFLLIPFSSKYSSSSINSENCDILIDYFDELSEEKLIDLLFNDEYFSSKNGEQILFFTEEILKKLMEKNCDNLIFKRVEKFKKSDEMLTFLKLSEKLNFDHVSIVNCISNSKFLNDEIIIEYLNNVVRLHDNEYREELAYAILENDLLFNYISVLSIRKLLCLPISNLKEYNKEFEPNEEELEELKMKLINCEKSVLVETFLEDSKTFNLLKKLSCDDILKIYTFNLFVGQNKYIMEIIPEFLKKYLSYEKAIFLLDKIEITGQEKINIINSVYPDKNIVSVNNAKNDIIERSLNRILNLEMPVPDEIKIILPDLLELPYNESFFNELKKVCLNIQCYEYTQIFIAQLTRFIAKSKDLKVDAIEFMQQDYSLSNKDTLAFWNNILKSVCHFYEEMSAISSYRLFKYIKTNFHEMRHAFQFQKMADIISLEALMCNLEIVTFNALGDDSYLKNYDNIFYEVDAEINAVYETFKFLGEIDRNLSFQYLLDNSAVISDFDLKDEYNKQNLAGTYKKRYLQSVKDNKDFIEKREKARSVEYFCQVINNFFYNISSDKIAELRENYKTIKLITNEFGRLYTIDEIEEKINSIKNYSTNDIEFNASDRDTKLFYIVYLNKLRYGIDNNLINIDGIAKEGAKGRSNS